MVSAALRTVSSIGSRTDGSSANTDRYAAAYGYAAVSAAVMNSDAANAGAPTAICERIG